MSPVVARLSWGVGLVKPLQGGTPPPWVGGLSFHLLIFELCKARVKIKNFKFLL